MDRLKNFSDCQERVSYFMDVYNKEVPLESLYDWYKTEKNKKRDFVKHSLSWKNPKDIYNSRTSCLSLIAIAAEGIFMKEIVNSYNFPETRIENDFQVQKFEFLCLLLFRHIFDN